MSDVKPREWIISPAFYDANNRQQTDDRIYDAEFELWPGWKAETTGLIDVIEKSAYDAVVKSLNEVKAERDELKTLGPAWEYKAKLEQSKKAHAKVWQDWLASREEVAELEKERDELKRQLDEIYNRQNG